jgi:hypothetical protein
MYVKDMRRQAGRQAGTQDVMQIEDEVDDTIIHVLSLSSNTSYQLSGKSAVYH